MLTAPRISASSNAQLGYLNITIHGQPVRKKDGRPPEGKQAREQIGEDGQVKRQTCKLSEGLSELQALKSNYTNINIRLFRGLKHSHFDLIWRPKKVQKVN